MFAVEEMEDLQQLKLIVEVVLQPDRHLVEQAMRADDRVAGEEVGAGLGIGKVETPAEIRGADIGQRRQVVGRDQGALMEDVAPGLDPAGEARGGEEVGRRIAVGDDQLGHDRGRGRMAGWTRTRRLPLPERRRLG